MDVLHGSDGAGGRVDTGGYNNGCDQVFDERLSAIEFGTIAAGSARVPAIRANYLYTCLSATDGARKRMTDFWVVLGIDAEASTYRCVKVAARPVVDEVANQCGFQVDAAAPATAPSLSAETPPVTLRDAKTDPSVGSPVPAGNPPADASDANVAAAAAYNELVRLAQSGDIDAETELGVQLLTGRGVAKDFAGAAAWFRKAAAARNPRAQTNLGWMLTLGQGVPRDDSAALALFTYAAAQSFPNAQDSLGWMYQHGRGVPRDFGIARDWYQKAADQGFARSVQNLKALEGK